MLRGLLFTLGILSALGGAAWASVYVLAAARSDDPQSTVAQSGLWTGGAALVVGVGLCAAAEFVR